MTDLTNDVEDIIDFMTYTKDGVIDSFITDFYRKYNNKIARGKYLLTNGLYFPFRIQTTNWQTIQKYVTISTHYPSIYITLRFPIVAYPKCTK